jgi:hypothetical protein
LDRRLQDEPPRRRRPRGVPRLRGERYRPQLDRYAAALAAIERRKVRVALYFPLLKELRTWPAG